jgi:hypothetical protein
MPVEAAATSGWWADWPLLESDSARSRVGLRPQRLARSSAVQYSGSAVLPRPPQVLQRWAEGHWLPEGSAWRAGLR